MNRYKQIEEMKLIIDKAEEEYSEIWNEWFYDYKEGTKKDNEFLFFAKMLYDAGYRKSTEVAREIFEEIENNYADFLFDGYRNIIVITEKDFAELKKKYTEEVK